jgi:VWFA-related protein
MQVLPIFVVDEHGKPVYDLSQEELQLFVDNKPIKFLLLRYDFRTVSERPVESRPFSEINQSKSTNKRVIFLVLDTIYNTKVGLNRSKKIAMSMIKKKLPGDYYIIMKITSAKGLEYESGPDENRERLSRTISKISSSPDLTSLNLRSFFSSNADSKKFKPSDPKVLKWIHAKHLEFLHSGQYINNTKPFSQSLGSLRYVLDTIQLPRMVFIFSEGIAKHAFTRSNRSQIYKRLKSSIQAVTSSGTLVCTINPLKEDSFNEKDSPWSSGEMSLQFMARQGGGKYFAGSNTEAIVENINQNVSAYYELAFSENIQAGHRKRLEIKSNRPGVKISTINMLEAKRTYQNMDSMGKKMFALNLVLNRNIITDTDSIKPAIYSFRHVKKNTQKNRQVFSIIIPENMVNKRCDIFKIQVSTQNKKNIITRESRKLKLYERIIMAVNSDQTNHFVVVDPKTSFSIYGNGDKANSPQEMPVTLIKKNHDSSFSIPSTSTQIRTKAGLLMIKHRDGFIPEVRLNGIAIYKTEGDLIFQKTYKSDLGDLVLLKISKGKKEPGQYCYRLLNIYLDGRYFISPTHLEEPINIDFKNNEFRVGGLKIELEKQGHVSKQQKEFYLFFYRFKHIESFQKDHVQFPFQREKYDPKTKQLIESEEVTSEEWEFTPFKNSPSLQWSEPKVSKNQAVIHLTGDGLFVKIIFKKYNQGWRLVKSENWSNI